MHLKPTGSEDVLDDASVGLICTESGKQSLCLLGVRADVLHRPGSAGSALRTMHALLLGHGLHLLHQQHVVPGSSRLVSSVANCHRQSLLHQLEGDVLTSRGGRSIPNSGELAEIFAFSSLVLETHRDGFADQFLSNKLLALHSKRVAVSPLCLLTRNTNT